MPSIEIYSSIECPYAYLTTYRLRQIWPEYAGRVRIVWRALSLEYINQRSHPKPLFEAEQQLFHKIEPDLPWKSWSRPEWDWPVTFLPAFEALACAQAQGDISAFAMSWALRHAFFAENKNLSLRHELLEIAEQVATEGTLDLEWFRDDWDHGRHKGLVLTESHLGWHDLEVKASATIILPDGRRWTNPDIGEVDFDEVNYVVRSFTPFKGDPTSTYRQILESVALEPLT
jgi:predicted DsbA family dithiol-disulfide isomerase